MRTTALHNGKCSRVVSIPNLHPETRSLGRLVWAKYSRRRVSENRIFLVQGVSLFGGLYRGQQQPFNRCQRKPSGGHTIDIDRRRTSQDLPSTTPTYLPKVRRGHIHAEPLSSASARLLVEVSVLYFGCLKNVQLDRVKAQKLCNRIGATTGIEVSSGLGKWRARDIFQAFAVRFSGLVQVVAATHMRERMAKSSQAHF